MSSSPSSAADRTSYPFSAFLDHHSSQLNASAVPPELWHSLYRKLSQQTFDAGDHFQIICEMNEGNDEKKTLFVRALDEMHNNEEQNIFLIDHFVSFSSESARKCVESNEGLAERLASLFGIDNDECQSEFDETAERIETSCEKEDEKHAKRLSESEIVGGAIGIPRIESVDARMSSYSVDDPKKALIDKVMKSLWKYAQTYTVSYQLENGEIEKKHVWYIMDDFGSRIRHSSQTQNVRIVPLMYVPQNCAYSIMFLTRPIEKDEEITMDWAANVITAQRPEWRKYIEMPWSPQDFSAESSTPDAPTLEYFTSGRNPDHLAPEKDQKTCESAIFSALPVMRKNGKIRVFADDTQLTEHLKTHQVEYVDDWKKADVIWMIRHFHDYGELAQQNPCAQINQFPFESCLTVKDLLATCAMRAPVQNDWYQLTYNLNTELAEFVAQFQAREKAENSPKNVWIVKPWNLARGMEMVVTDDLNQIIRMIETGPKIVCEYIARPLLFPRPDNGNLVKFDLRHIVFVNGISPVTAYVYNRFWIRFAINQFQLLNYDDVETHFTVFNYLNKEKVLQMKCEQFIETIEKTYPTIQWKRVQADINSKIRKAIEAAAKEPAPCGVAPNVQSRAMYGVDIMLQHDDKKNDDVIKPTLLEINFMPDTTRACQYYPDFADTVFDTMFLENIDPTKVTPI